MDTRGYVYHVEIFFDHRLQRLQDRANAYLEECQELPAALVSCMLQWLDDKYHLTIVLSIQTERED